MKTKKKLLIGLGAVAVLTAVIAVTINARRKDLVSVEADEISRRDELVAVVSATGEIKPKEYVELQAEISGVITELIVEEGDVVEKGAILLKIDPVQTRTETLAQRAVLAAAEGEARNQEAQIAVQQSNVARDRANVRAAEVDLDNARANLDLAVAVFERKQEVYEANLIPKEDYQAAKNNLVNARSAVASAEARLEQAVAQHKVSEVVLDQAHTSLESSRSRVAQQRAILARSEDLLSKTVIRSPLAGVITQMNVEAGERAVPGTLNNPAATLMVIADLSIIEAEVEVDETDIIDVDFGQKSVVKVDALPDQPLEGVVTEIGNSAIQKSGSDQEAKDFKVIIQLVDPPSSLRPGLSCTGEITTATRQEVLTVPIQALTVREFPIDDDGNPIFETEEVEEEKEGSGGSKRNSKEFEGVFRVSEGKALFTPVETGILGEAEIEILSGLDEGTTIVTGSYKTLRTLSNGDRVSIEERG
jgi:HlyD family secretion protein